MEPAKDAKPAPKLTPRQHVDRAIRHANELRDEIQVLATEHPVEAETLGLADTTRDLNRLAGRLHVLLAIIKDETT